MKRAITSGQCRLARALLDWSRERLAKESGVGVRTLADFELESDLSRAITAEKLISALETAGIEFIREDGGGPGVRLRKT